MSRSYAIERIMIDDWYKSASKEEMKAALMFVRLEGADSLFNGLYEKYNSVRGDIIADGVANEPL